MKKVLLLVAIATLVFTAPTITRANDSAVIVNIETGINTANNIGVPVDTLENVDSAIEAVKHQVDTVPPKGSDGWAWWKWALSVAGVIGGLILLGVTYYKKYKKGGKADL